MAQIKLVEIRDRGTFIPAMAIRVSGDDGYLMRRAGFDSPMVYLVALATEKCAYDPYNWNNRTMNSAHHFIEAHFDTLTDGHVVDVEFILGETSEPKVSEELTAALKAKLVAQRDAQTAKKVTGRCIRCNTDYTAMTPCACGDNASLLHNREDSEVSEQTAKKATP